MPVKGKPKTKRQIREAKKLEEELEENRAEAGGKQGRSWRKIRRRTHHRIH
jgi:hypothetical protein